LNEIDKHNGEASIMVRKYIEISRFVRVIRKSENLNVKGIESLFRLL